jgi:nitrite reductase/ring-hydroxylating ferredoxin subunit
VTFHRIKLAPLESIPDRDSRGFDVKKQGRDQLFVIRRGEEVIAWRNNCPHRGFEGTSMAWKKHAYLNKNKTKIFCSAHGAQFDIESGECFLGPCLGQKLERMDVRLAEDGYVYWYTETEEEN